MTFEEKDQVENALIRIEGMMDTLEIIEIHLQADANQDHASRALLSESLFALEKTIRDQVKIIYDLVLPRGGGKIDPSKNPELEKLLKVLDKQYLPANLSTIKSVYNSQKEDCLGIVYVYNYGRIKGIQSERDKNKWNRLATVLNTNAYIQESGKFPTNYEEVDAWIKQKGKDKNGN